MEAVEVQEEAEVVDVAATKSEQNAKAKCKSNQFSPKSKNSPWSLKHGTALNRCCQDRDCLTKMMRTIIPPPVHRLGAHPRL